MMTNAAPAKTHSTAALNNWLKAVNRHLDERKMHRQALPRPKRNRERERARREARRLFHEYYLEMATGAVAA